MICAVCTHPIPFSQMGKYCSAQCRYYKRPFRVWDGEGRTIRGKHYYVLLSYRDPHSRDSIYNPKGLSTEACLEFLCRPRPKAINIWFAFGYDVNKILEDVPLKRPFASRKELWEEGATRWKRRRISYTPRKMFQVSSAEGSFNSFDSFGFFQMSFLKACKKWDIDTASFEKGKAERANFGKWSYEQICEYNDAEMDALLDLAQRLRDVLARTNLLPTQWHGSGAIANVWLKRNDPALPQYPEVMQAPILHGYFGGRIDINTIGEVEVFKNDLASAYPAAARECLSCDNWKYVRRYAGDSIHALYHVRWSIPSECQWGPFPWRDVHGSILYPSAGEGWYWGAEVLSATRCFDGIQILGAWVPQVHDSFPLAESITDDYDKRLALKDANDPAENALKLALNSIYGKFAQHSARWGTPRWQNYIWAGFITSWCRGKILDILAEVGQENMVAIATDGIFTRVPIVSSNQTKQLGTWQDEGFGPALILAPGLYATFHGDKAQVYKSRGMPSAINYGYVLRQWGCTTKRNTEGKRSTVSKRDAFIGMGLALHRTDQSVCGTFQSQERRIACVPVFGTSKRIPLPELIGMEGWREYPLARKERKKEAPLLSETYQKMSYREDDEC